MNKNITDTVKAVWSKAVIRHSFYWLLSAFTMYILIAMVEDHILAMKVSMTVMLPGPFIVYSHNWALTHLFERRHYGRYALSVLLILAASEPLVQIIHDLVEKNPESHTSGIGTAILFILLPSGYRYFMRGVKQQYLLQEAQSKQLETELALLSSQINPHFFFNTLNNLYALSLDSSEQVPQVILQLSELMRYVLEGARLTEVALQKELDFLENYIALERLRLDNDVDIRINLSADGNVKIAPLLLIPFVENGFKHGMNGGGSDAWMHLDISIDQGSLKFRLANSVVQPAQPGRSTGLGLSNVKRRLELLYPDRHRLNIDETADRFTVSLEVVL